MFTFFFQYPIVREFDKKQTDEEIKDEILKVVDFLIRDESNEPSSIVEVEEPDDDSLNKINDLALD